MARAREPEWHKRHPFCHVCGAAPFKCAHTDVDVRNATPEAVIPPKCTLCGKRVAKRHAYPQHVKWRTHDVQVTRTGVCVTCRAYVRERVRIPL